MRPSAPTADLLSHSSQNVGVLEDDARRLTVQADVDEAATPRGAPGSEADVPARALAAAT